MTSPRSRRYSESHEWFSVEGDLVTIGLTPYAASELTDITYVEMKPAGTALTPGDSVGEVESVKTSSDVLAAVGGEVTEVNDAVREDPSLINSDPYGAGWLVKIRTSDTSPLDALLDQERYDATYPVD